MNRRMLFTTGLLVFLMPNFLFFSYSIKLNRDQRYGSEKEIAGLIYADSLNDIMKDLQTLLSVNNLKANNLHRKFNLTNNLKLNSIPMKKKFKQTSIIDEKYKDTLLTGLKWTLVYDRYQYLSTLSDSPNDKIERINEIIGKINSLYDFTIIQSGVFLTPNLKNQYLANLLLKIIPHNTKYIESIRSNMVIETYTDNNPSTLKKYLSETVKTINMQHEIFHRIIQAVFNESYSIKVKLYKEFSHIAKYHSTLMELSEQVSISSSNSLLVKEVFSSTTRLIDAYHKIQQSILTILLNDLENNLNINKKSMLYMLLTLSISFVGIMVASMYFYRNMIDKELSDIKLQESLDSLSRSHHELKQAVTEAEKANETKSQFLASVSHELRTPLNGILGISELMLKETITEEQAYNLNLIIHSTENLVQVINDILDISKIEAGEISLNNISFKLHDIIIDTCQNLRVIAERKGLTFNVNCSGDLPNSVCGDKIRLVQILYNVVGNAIKYTQNGSVTVGW